MEDLTGKVAVITGAASGIGLALAERFAAEGARVVLADVERGPLEEAAADLGRRHGAERVLAVPTDVRSPEEVEALADAAFDRFGAAHVVCNNAGVAVGGLAWNVPAERWRWVVDVNLFGVVNGIRAFVPRLIEQGEGHVVNTASAAGLLTGPVMGPYCATKHAVVALSESLYCDLQVSGSNVGVSVLCPEWVRTNISDSDRNQPAEATADDPAPGLAEEASRDLMRRLVESGLDPAEVAAAVTDAIARGRFWVLTHPTTLVAARRRWDAIATDGTPRLWQLRDPGAPDSVDRPAGDPPRG